MGRAIGCSDSGLPQVSHRFVPYLASQGVMGETLNVFDKSICIKPLDGFANCRVKERAGDLGLNCRKPLGR